jgi:hypothetical protein
MRLVAIAVCTLIAATVLPGAPVPKPKSEFEQKGWDKEVDPDGDCKFSKGAKGLTIEVPAKDHDIDGRRKRLNAPRLVRDFEGDFRVEVRVEGNFHATETATALGAAPYSAAGLFVDLGAKSASTVRFEFGATRYKGKEERYVFLKHSHEKGGVSGNVRYGTGKGWPLKAGEAYLRLERTGAKFMTYYSADGKKWTPLGGLGKVKAPEKVKVGVVALCTSKGALKVTFDQFKLTGLKAK